MPALTRIVVLLAVVACGVHVQADGAPYAQSLGEIARQEEARRKSIKTPGKVYTNEDLGESAVPPATGTPAPPAAAQPQDDDTADEAADAPPPPQRDEKYWRGRIDAARTALSRSQTFAAALQTRINSLAADFVNRDDPAQRNVIAAERQKALGELDRVKQDIATQDKAIADIQEEARRANVPAGWVR